MDKKRRNRLDTTQRIVDALEQVLTEKGLDGVGVNAVAEKAGVSKVLIYRYFGGIEGLLDYYVHMGRLFPHYTPNLMDQIYPPHQGEIARRWSNQSLQLFRQFRASKAAREVLKATVKEHDTLSDAASKAHDEELVKLVSQFSLVEGVDSEATSAIVLGALSYLTLLAQNNRPMIGLDLRNESAWSRIEGAVEQIYRTLSKQTQEGIPSHRSFDLAMSEGNSHEMAIR
jgi:AcrR family transcriptional regulator